MLVGSRQNKFLCECTLSDLLPTVCEERLDSDWPVKRTTIRTKRKQTPLAVHVVFLKLDNSIIGSNTAEQENETFISNLTEIEIGFD